MKIALASQSPRRRQLLEQLADQMGFEVVLLPPGPEEDAELLEAVLPQELPTQYVQRVTALKAEAGWRRLLARGLPTMPVLASDTTVAIDNEILGKPLSPEEAKAMLWRLSGRVHTVLTAVALIRGDQLRGDQLTQVLSESEVKFCELSGDWIDWVVATGEPMDKAGAYAIQGHAGAMIEWVKGSPSGIMGLPLFETAQLLRAALT
ncbi:MAG: septum formation protein Maf [Betaproteobacteria bacterium]|nr:septum formation protein Maf [Betaproteobacteria bacterium]